MELFALFKLEEIQWGVCVYIYISGAFLALIDLLKEHSIILNMS